MELFRKLSAVEDNEFRLWARKNYKPFTPINGLYHPAVQDECQKMNAQAQAEIDYVVRGIIP